MKYLLARCIATGFGIGYFPYGPGTMGALALTVGYWFAPEIEWIWFVVLLIMGTVVGVVSSSLTERFIQISSGDQTHSDPQIIVIDEIVGMLFALLALPKTATFVAAAFVLFRFFDIVKPFPVNKFEKLPSGWGIMLDDIAAGILANVILHVARMIVAVV